MIHRLRTAAATIALTAAMSCTHPHHGLAQTAPTPPPTLTGTWTVGLIGDHVIPMVFVLDQQGTSVSGALGFMGKDYPLSGDIKDGRITITAKFPASVSPSGVHGTDLTDVAITGGWDDHGGLAGDFRRAPDESGRGMHLPWKAERAQARSTAATAAAPSADVSLAGAWSMTVVEAQLQIGLTLTQQGIRVTGAATSDHLGPITLEGTFRDGMVTLVGHGSQQGQDLRMDFSGRYTADGTLAGEVVSPVGTMTWTAARVRQ